MRTDASPARVNEVFHVGGVFSRRSRASLLVSFFFSSAVGGRPVRPRAWIVPAAVPRCLVRRLRLVWAMVPWSLVGGAVGPPLCLGASAARPCKSRQTPHLAPPLAT